MTTPTAVPDLVLPQVSLKIIADPVHEGRELMLMVFETAVTHYEALICDNSTFTETANKIANAIIEAGRSMKRPSGLIAVKGGLPDGLKNGNPRPPQRG